MQTTKKYIILVDKFGFLDPTSSAFHKALAETVDGLVVINQLTHDLDQESVTEQILNSLKEAGIAFCLSINGVGMGSPLFEKLRTMSIPIFSWYWDTPAGESDRMRYLYQFSEVFFGCSEYSRFPGFNGRGIYLPFAGSKPVENRRSPTKEIGFLGSCWHVVRIMQKLALGLFSVTDQRLYSLVEVYELVQNDQFLMHRWQTVGGERIPEWDILNAFSAIKRLQHLSNVTDFDLHVYGGVDWLLHSAATAPQIGKHFHQQLVKNDTEMHDLMTQFKISLNIFHLQNRNGGPNFRIFDSIVHGVPILSDWNLNCEKIFPNLEAAMYYKNPSEMRSYASELIKDPSLSLKLIKKSREILLEGHLHSHRVASFWDKVGKFEYSKNPKVLFLNNLNQLVVYDENSPNPWPTDNHPTSGNIEETQLYKTEKYWAESYKTMEWEIKDRTEKIEALNKELKSYRLYSLKHNLKKIRNALRSKSTSS